MMATNPIGLYVHIPFCKRKCNYCDFCSEASSDEKMNLYTDMLSQEILSYKNNSKTEIDSIFFGGGTPSLLSAENFLKIASSIKESFKIKENCEITLEVNPATLTLEKLDAYKFFGVNRISIGLQSIHENEQKKLGRIHSYDDFLNTFDTLRNAGIENISVDLMYGIPLQTKESFKQTVRTVLALKPEHISCYGLIVEHGTPFFDMLPTLEIPDEDSEADMYEIAHAELIRAGYLHYEISNYAKPGRECRHNLKYWRDEEYIGVGISAHSFYLGKRFYNTSSFDEYFDNFGINYRVEERVNSGHDPFEYAMLSLRLSEGLSLEEYQRLFGRKFAEGKEDKIKLFIDNGLIEITKERIRLTYKGFYISNTILADLL